MYFNSVSRKIILLVTFLCLTIAGFTQIDTTIKLDILRAPSSPAATLLNMSDADIQKPTDPTSLMTTIRNATNNFTNIPKSFALDLAPFKLFGKKYVDTRYLEDTKKQFRQSTVLSLAVNTVEKNDSVPNSVNKTQLGIGLKFALVRGKINKETKDALETIYSFQKTDENLIREIRTNDDEANSLQKTHNLLFKDSVRIEREIALLSAGGENAKRATDSLKIQLAVIKLKKDETDSLLSARIFKISSDSDYIKKAKALKIDDINEKIKKQAAKIKLERIGFSLDFAAGTVVDFLDNKMNSSYITKAGGWLTGGYTDEKTSSSLLFIVRYLYNPKTAVADPNLKLENLHTLDFGGRFIINTFEKKLQISAESIYRSILNKASAKSSYRILFNAEYEVGVNQKLTFTFGRNFDGETYKGGNIISALNLILGFGNEKISKKPSN